MNALGPNMLFTAASNVTGIRFDPFSAFKFYIEIEGILSGGFSECSGLQVETEVYEYREGGVNEFIHHFPGPTKYPPLILKHGLTPLDGIWEWHQDVVSGKFKRKNGTIFLLNKRGLPVMWWNFEGAFPVKWVGPELRAESAAVAFESVQLVHRGISKPRESEIFSKIGAEITGNPYNPGNSGRSI